jgi:hypothetical protein
LRHVTSAEREQFVRFVCSFAPAGTGADILAYMIPFMRKY